MEYNGTVYIGVVGPDNEPGQCRDSIERIGRRPGDDGPHFARATKGYEARQTHLNNFIKSRHDFILLLDHDMTFPPDALERLRSHKLPYISGLYMRRSYNPIAPIWFKPWSGAFPYEPWVSVIERGKLHKLGASGWGCVLIHREVVLAVRKLLHGEWEILEDDMDVYPYDLTAIMGAITGLRSLLSESPGMTTLLPALEHHTRTLEEQIRPLRADRDQIGSDIRFPFFAMKAGYQLWGDPDVRCGHILDYPLSADDFDHLAPQQRENLEKSLTKRIKAERKRMKGILRAVKS